MLQSKFPLELIAPNQIADGAATTYWQGGRPIIGLINTDCAELTVSPDYANRPRVPVVHDADTMLFLLAESAHTQEPRDGSAHQQSGTIIVEQPQCMGCRHVRRTLFIADRTDRPRLHLLRHDAALRGQIRQVSYRFDPQEYPVPPHFHRRQAALAHPHPAPAGNCAQ